MKVLFIWIIKGYQSFISPLFPPTCRFRPTCSQYALVAMRKFGAIRGSWLTLKRLLRCHPFHPGGYDPVPGISTVDKKSLSEAIRDLEIRRKALQINPETKHDKIERDNPRE